jgi:hypothetical protein
MLDELELIPALLKRMHQSPRDQALMYCRRLLAITLAEGATAFLWDVLAEVADNDSLWSGQELPQILECYDLPTDRETLRLASMANAGTQPRIVMPLT